MEYNSYHDVSVAFSNEAQKPFFNAGGSIYFTASRSGGASNDEHRLD